MRIMRKMRWIVGMVVVAVVFMVLLTGCTEVLNEWYISNHTDSEVEVRFTPFYTETLKMTSGPLIEDIGSRPSGLVPDAVDYEIVDGEVQFRMGPRQTVFLGISTGGNELFSSLELTLGDRRLALDEADQWEVFRVIDNFIGAVVHVLDVREDMAGLE